MVGASPGTFPPRREFEDRGPQSGREALPGQGDSSLLDVRGLEGDDRRPVRLQSISGAKDRVVLSGRPTAVPAGGGPPTPEFVLPGVDDQVRDVEGRFEDREARRLDAVLRFGGRVSRCRDPPRIAELHDLLDPRAAVLVLLLTFWMVWLSGCLLYGDEGFDAGTAEPRLDALAYDGPNKNHVGLRGESGLTAAACHSSCTSPDASPWHMPPDTRPRSTQGAHQATFVRAARRAARRVRRSPYAQSTEAIHRRLARAPLARAR